MTADYYDFFHEFKRGGAAHIKEVRGINRCRCQYG
jgi:hypothetical protein